jgi:hypothetical protein
MNSPKYKVGDCFLNTYVNKIRIIERIEIEDTAIDFHKYIIKNSFMFWFEHEIDAWTKVPESVAILYS